MDYLKSLFDRSLDAVVGMDAEGRVTAWNCAAEEIFGWSRAAAIGSSMAELIVPPQHREGHTRGLAHCNRTGEGPVLEQRIRISAIHHDGTEFPVELSIFPMNEQNREPMFYAFIRSLRAEERFNREQELRAREAEAVMAIGQKLIDDVSLEEFTLFCLDQVCQIAGMDAAHLFIRRGKGSDQALIPSGIWHLRDDSFRPVIEETANLQFKLGEGLPGRAWQTGKLEALDCLASESAFVRRESFAEVGLTRGVALPIQHGGEIHAVLEFFGTETSRLDPEILRMLKTIGNQIGAAIRRKESVENREMLRQEMVHRVGNSLSVLSAIYRSCSRNAACKEELDEAFLGRIDIMGRSNRMAIIEAETGIPLRELMINSIEILPNPEEIQIEAPSIMIPSESVLPLSLIFNELATNALKYGALGSESKLEIRVKTDPSSDVVSIEWCELRDHLLDQAPSHTERIGFGSQLVQAMVEGRLRGTFERQIDEAGFHFIMRLPKAHIISSTEKSESSDGA